MNKGHATQMDRMVIAMVALGLLGSSGCKKEDQQPVEVPSSAQEDASGNTFATVLIGSQRWMAEDLRTSHYGNGDPIDYVPSTDQWSTLTTGAWSNYDNDYAYGEIYGKLYNWYAVTDPRNVCPTGWHVPTDEDWMELEQTLGVPVSALYNTGSRGSGANVGGQLKSLVYWDAPNTGATNSSGFTALPGGSRTVNGSYSNVGRRGNWWTASEQDDDIGWFRTIWWNGAGIYRLTISKHSGNSVRCVQD